MENCEEGREGKDENLEGSSKLKEISDDMHVFLPLLIFPPVEISPVEILRNNRGGRGIFFIVEREEKKWKRWGRGRNSEAGKV